MKIQPFYTKIRRPVACEIWVSVSCPPLSAIPLGHCACCNQLQSRLRRAFRHPSSFPSFLLSLSNFSFFPLFHLPSFPLVLFPSCQLAFFYFLVARAGPPGEPSWTKVGPRWRPGLLLTTLGTISSFFLVPRKVSKKTTIFQVFPNRRKMQNQSALPHPRLAFKPKIRRAPPGAWRV